MASTAIRAHAITAQLVVRGWQRSREATAWVGECTAINGCSRPGRWTHANVTGNYCAQHAHGVWK